MARINVKATVSAPAEINIPLIRADHAFTSNIFRVSFEVFLSLTSTLGGYILSLQNVAPFYWVVLALSGVVTSAFLAVSICVSNKAKEV